MARQHRTLPNPGRRFAARLALFALLLQTFFPAVFSGFTSSPAHAWDQVVLCTSDGLKTVPLADLGEQLPDQKAPHAPYCPACPGYFQANAAIPPAGIAAAKPSFAAFDRILPADDRGPDGRRFVPQSARAPPTFA